VGNDIKNAGANVAYGAADWGSAGRNIGAAFSGKDRAGKNLSIMGRITKGLSGLGDAALGAGAAASTASLLIPGAGEVAKGADLALEGAVNAGRAVKAGDAAVEGAKDAITTKPPTPPADTFVPKPKDNGGGVSGSSQFIGPKATTTGGSTMVKTKPNLPAVKPYTDPRPAPAPSYPNPGRSTTIGDRPPINSDVPAPAAKPQLRTITSEAPKAATEPSIATEPAPATEEQPDTSRSSKFKTAAAVATGTMIGGALLGGNSKSGTPDKWNPSSIL
jgi:hypothetical protein